MRDELRTAVRDTWERALDEERTVSVPAVVDRVIATHRALYGREMERLGRSALLRWVKDLARTESDADGQLSLFGLPAVIALPDPADVASAVDASQTLQRQSVAVRSASAVGRGDVCHAPVVSRRCL